MIQNERIQSLNRKEVQKGKFVLYWMQASQRAEYNHALEYAILRANELNKPLLVFLGITDSYPFANQRQYYFMLQGLREVQITLDQRNIPFLIQQASPEKAVVELAQDACLSLKGNINCFDISDIDLAISRLNIDKSVDKSELSFFPLPTHLGQSDSSQPYIR
jgi:deoxyribodipyrimidine photolyase